MSSDGLLHRLRRDTVLACGAMALLAVAVDPRRPAAALGVLGGGLLVAMSYAAVAYTIDVFMSRREEEGLERPSSPPQHPGRPSAKRKKAFALLLFAGHYALLAFAAYVMIARLRLHPIGLLGGVTSLVAAVAAEAVRVTRR